MSLRKILATGLVLASTSCIGASHTETLPQLNVCKTGIEERVGSRFGQRSKLRMIDSLDEFIRKEYGLNSGQSFCYTTDQEDEKKWALAATKKFEFNSEDEPLHVHQVGTKQQMKDLATRISGEYDVSVYEVYTPYSQITKRYLSHDNPEIASLFFHERLHEELGFPRILEESMATLVGRIGAIEFFQSGYGKEWARHQRKAKKNLDWKMKRARVIVDAYDALRELYSDDTLSRKEKQKRQRRIFWKVRWKLLDKTVNNATIAKEVYYLKNLGKLYTIYVANGARLDVMLTFFKSLPQDYASAKALVDAAYQDALKRTPAKRPEELALDYI